MRCWRLRGSSCESAKVTARDTMWIERLRESAGAYWSEAVRTPARLSEKTTTRSPLASSGSIESPSLVIIAKVCGSRPKLVTDQGLGGATGFSTSQGWKQPGSFMTGRRNGRNETARAIRPQPIPRGSNVGAEPGAAQPPSLHTYPAARAPGYLSTAATFPASGAAQFPASW
jgi:hypothetical protein